MELVKHENSYQTRKLEKHGKTIDFKSTEVTKMRNFALVNKNYNFTTKLAKIG